MANTFELIASSTVGSGGAASIDFTSIPSTYTDLCLKVSGRSASSGVNNYTLEFNNLSTNFSRRNLFGSGSSVGSGSASNNTTFAIGEPNTYTANTFDNLEIYFPNYAGSSNKSFSIDAVTENNATESYAVLEAGLWSNTSAINRIKIFPSGSTFLQYSTAYLYGVKNA